MRMCIRCGEAMQENCAIKVEGTGYGIVMSTKKDAMFRGRIGIPNVAVCPKCGEVSIYMADTSKLSVEEE